MKNLNIPKWMLLIVEIGKHPNRHVMSLYKKVQVEYAHSFKITQIIKEQGLIHVEKVGRANLLSLTDKGKTVASACYIILKVMKDEKGFE